MQLYRLRPGLCPLPSVRVFRTGVPYRANRQRFLSLRSAAQKGKSDDEDKGRYPERSALTGGWAGGEKGLQKFIDEFKEDPTDEKKNKLKKAAKKDPNVVSIKFKGKEVEARRREGSGSDAIYIGKRKGGPIGDADEVYIVDDDRKYPQKEDMGGFAGVVGGFAGGERGVQQFVEKGEVSLSQASKEPGSPLVFAILIAAVGTIGGILITNVTKAGESALTAAENGQLSAEMNNLRVAGFSLFNSNAQIDDNTKIVIEVGLFVAGVLTIITLGRSAVDGLTTNVRTGFLKATTLVLFFAAVGVALKFVVEN